MTVQVAVWPPEEAVNVKVWLMVQPSDKIPPSEQEGVRVFPQPSVAVTNARAEEQEWAASAGLQPRLIDPVGQPLKDGKQLEE